MAHQQQKKSKDTAGYAFMICMLSVVMVFAFGLMIGKQSQAQQTETVSQSANSSVTEPSENAVQQEETTESVSETEKITTITPAENTPEFKQATSFWCSDAHVYLRINHEKQLELFADPDFDLSDVIYGVSDASIAAVDESGMIIGLTKGECIVSVFCGAETLRIPVTVREMTVENECTYIDDILIVNKEYSIPESYDPGMLAETEEAFTALQTAAKAQGLDIYEGSGYRSYQYQITVYNSMVNAYGEEYASCVSAAPGHSEHQTGYTIDCNTINEAFGYTAEGQWLAEHCHEYGFIIRYPEGKENITGYAYEPWHIRYVGVEHATAIYEQGLTLEEYLDVVPEAGAISILETAEEQTEISETAAESVLSDADNAEFADAPEEAPVPVG